MSRPDPGCAESIEGQAIPGQSRDRSGSNGLIFYLVFGRLRQSKSRVVQVEN